LVNFLIENGAKIDIRDQTISDSDNVEQGDSPLIMACIGNHRGIVKLLLDCGADKELKGPVSVRFPGYL
jgi:ankyrin repeat protein